ncbi:DUF2919 domain-containing protein [Pseudoalteromonas tunicata]|uniref:DUF2919 domain-containing protein n=1 Tax=Pseudoalteromonas tunicata TaxID=314281 RepID=UPI00273ED3A6|nr:DUF2919 domain-containing protein [Pseudoalteromonas tunicata]MDP4982589.1 DUF2919 domain-containing protein [Pseudoalteromonas tunicata]
MTVFGPEYWDKHGLYKAPIGFVLTLAVLMRAYLIWILAAVSRQPELDIMGLFYRDKDQFFVALAIASISLPTVVLYFLRRPDAKPHLRRPWRFMKWPLVCCAVVDLVWLVLQSAHNYFAFSEFIAIQAMLLIWVLLYLFNSRYLPVFFKDWPEPVIVEKPNASKETSQSLSSK